MRWRGYYQNLIGVGNEAEAFDYLVGSLKQTNRKYAYFVDWQKVLENVKEVETELHLFDVLIGKPNIEERAIKLFTDYPKAMKAVPVLIAVRENRLSLLTGFDRRNYIEQCINFDERSKPQDVASFMSRVGFLRMLADSKIHSVIDYVMGVEVGLDSNGRKNRGGKSMENIIGVLLNEIGAQRGWEIMPEATKKKISEKWSLEINIGNANKRLDFAIKTANQLFLIETNFYSASGSKLKSTANEYCSVWNSYGFPFIWITDGQGWKNDKSLKDAFSKIDHILNIDMVQKGLLEAIILEYTPATVSPAQA